MNNKKLLVLLILTIFCVGMMMETASAGYSFYAGHNNEIKLSNNEYKKIVNHKVHYLYKKTNGYKTVKIPKYKNKKVTKTKWKYKKVKYQRFEYRYNIKLTNMNQYYKNGWKKYDSKWINGYNYVYLKKKVSYKVTKKVKSGYKKVKLPIMAKIGLTGKEGQWGIYSYVEDSKLNYYKSLGWYYFEYP